MTTLTSSPKDWTEIFRQWYGGFVTTSELDVAKTIRFISSAAGLIAALVDGSNNKNVSVYVTKDVETASINLKERKIFLNESLIDTIVNTTDDNIRFRALLTYNGLMIHEIGHLANTLISIEDFPLHVSEFDIDNKALVAICQVIEDYFIDGKNMRDFPNLVQLMAAAFETYFPENEFDVASMLLTKPKDLNEASTTINQLISLKNPVNVNKFRSRTWKSSWFSELFDLAFSSSKKKQQYERIKLSIEVYEKIFDGIEMPTEEPKVQDFLKLLVPTDSELGEEESEQIESGAKEVTEIDGSIKIVMSKDGNGYNVTKIGLNDIPPASSKDKRYKFTESAKWRSLKSLIKIRSESVTNRGPQRNRGNRINQLSRIVTDGKIFTTQTSSKALVPQEIIILVDLSGSMRDRDNWEIALNEALSMAKALEGGHHNVAVYGHTANLRGLLTFGNPNCMAFLIEIKPFSRSTKLAINLSNHIHYNLLANNADGYAIREVSKLFTKKQATKTLLVISDGAPAAIGYRNSREHTRDEVNKVRSCGINVLSASIDESAVDVNDFIYGEQHNFFIGVSEVGKILIEKILKI